MRKPRIKIGDEVNAYLRVKGNKVKEITGIVSEISKNGYVRLRTCRRWLTVIKNSRSAEKTGGFKENIPKKKEDQRVFSQDWRYGHDKGRAIKAENRGGFCCFEEWHSEVTSIP